MTFANRAEAALHLSQELHAYKGRNPLILAIPRGAVPMGAILADAMDGELDVILVRKLRAPGYPEYAIGSVDEEGRVYVNADSSLLDITPQYIEREMQLQMQTIQLRRASYGRPPVSPRGRTVIVLDDGIATGYTLLAALEAVRAQHPATLIAATAVAPPDALQRIQDAADDVACLLTPHDFRAVGQYFRDFSQVSDDEVRRLLRTHAHCENLVS